MGRLRKLVAVAMVLPTVGCSGGGKLESGDAVVERFVRQVNDRSCDEASGFDVVQTAWSDACWSTVGHLGEGVVLAAEPVTEYGDPEEPDGSSWWARYESHMEYVNSDGVPTRLLIAFDETGMFDHRLRLTRIDSSVFLTLGTAHTYDYPVDDTIDPDGKAFIEQVEGLLADGSCDEIETLMVPADVFGGASTDDCPAFVTMYADLPEGGSLKDWWDPAVYSVEDAYGGGDVYGIARREGEDVHAYADRVVAAIADTHKKLTKHIGGRQFIIEAVLYDGRWRLLNIRHIDAMDGFTF